MEINKITEVNNIVQSVIKEFSVSLEEKFKKDLSKANGIINRKGNNVFISELGSDFMFNSAFMRSFDSSLGNVLENMGNKIAGLFYDVRNEINSFILPEQQQHISNIMGSYDQHTKPEMSHYTNNVFIIPKDVTSFQCVHQTDNYFYDDETKTHYLIELKAGGDLDNKKSRAEKVELLKEYYLLKNQISQNENVKIFFATAYNKDGEGNNWKQERVRQFFAEEELLIGKYYWDFVCKDKDGFNVIIDQYKKNAVIIKEAIERIKKMFKEVNV